MQSKSHKIKLTDIKDGSSAIIIDMDGGKKAVKRLADLGLTTGTEIKVVRKALFSGPIQIEAAGSKLVIGRGLASKIFLELI